MQLFSPSGRSFMVKACHLSKLLPMAGALFFSNVAAIAQQQRSGTNGERLTIDATIPSSLLSAETIEVMDGLSERWIREWSEITACGESLQAGGEAADEISRCKEQAFKRTGFYKRLRQTYKVNMYDKIYRNVRTEIFEPLYIDRNDNRVIINLHAGAFREGSGISSKIESIPVASVGGIRVVSVDYRLGPVHRFPAATEDVLTVYKELLKEHRASEIGIYGCSAGGLLAAQVTAAIIKGRLPVPGAVGMFCEGAAYWTEGDTGGFRPRPDSPDLNPYFSTTHAHDPMAFPIRSSELLSQFPPSLLISGTRDWAMSSVVRTHSELVRLGVEANLHVWEGMGHAFIHRFDIPESREAFDVITKFFARHLGRRQ